MENSTLHFNRLSYYGFGERPLEKHEKQHFTESTTSLWKNLLNKIEEIFRKIKTFFITPRPNTTNLDREIQNLQINPIRVGEWTEDNTVLVSGSAKETTDWRLELIKSANSSIEIGGTYVGGEVFRTTLHAIEERIKQKPALQVHLLIIPDLLEKKDRELLKKLEMTYPQNFHCLKSHFTLRGAFRGEIHWKSVIIDEKYCIIGSTNLQNNLSREVNDDYRAESMLDRFLGGGTIEIDLVVCGSLAIPSRIEFFKLYALVEAREKKTKVLINHYKAPQPNPGVVAKFHCNASLNHKVKFKAVVGCPDATRNDCEREYVQHINRVGKQGGSVTIANMYFHPSKPIEDAIKANIKNIKFSLITTGVQSGAPFGTYLHGLANQVVASNIKVMSEDKAEIYFAKRGLNVYHRKCAVFKAINQTPSVIIGSFNLGKKSLYDEEMIAVIENSAVAEKVLEILQQDKKKAVVLKYDDAKKNSKSIVRRFVAHVQRNITH